MAVSIFLIYKLCHFFNIEIKWSSLVLCAVMAFIVNGAAISMSPFLDRAHYLRLGILVITAAAAVTIFNERLLRREEAVAGNYTSLATEILAPEDMPAPPPEEKKAAETPSPAPADTAVAARLAAKQEAEEAVRAAEALAAEKAAAEKAAAEKAAAEKAAAEKAAAEKAAAEKAAAEKAAAEKAAAEKAAAEKAAAEKAAAEKAAAEKAAAEKAAAEKAAAEKAAAEKAAHQQELQAKLGSMNSLDDILDFAYAAKDQQPQDAIFAYQEAIARFSDDDYMPFLIIELGNLYKEQADYRGAVATYAKAMHLPIIADNDAMRQEFAKNIRYLGVVQDILAKHSALSTPFPQIPGSIMQEIETEFQSQNDRAAN